MLEIPAIIFRRCLHKGKCIIDTPAVIFRTMPAGKREMPAQVIDGNVVKSDGKRPPCVLVTTGALNPVHLGHLEMLERAKRTMEENGYEVLAGWISPSHEGYVQWQSTQGGHKQYKITYNYKKQCTIAETCCSICLYIDYFALCTLLCMLLLM